LQFGEPLIVGAIWLFTYLCIQLRYPQFIAQFGCKSFMDSHLKALSCS